MTPLDFIAHPVFGSSGQIRSGAAASSLPSRHATIFSFLLKILYRLPANAPTPSRYASVQPNPCSPRLSDFATVPVNSRYPLPAFATASTGLRPAATASRAARPIAIDLLRNPAPRLP